MTSAADAPARHAMWTPLPPERSGIADYSYELLECLGRSTDVVAVSRDPSSAQVPDGVEVIDSALAKRRFGSVRHRSTGLNVYQMGNHHDTHSWIYDHALVEPGVVVLHDTSLLGFAFTKYGDLNHAEFRAEIEYAHGPIGGNSHDPALFHGWPALDVDGVLTPDGTTMTMERRLIESSLGVIVHDPYSAGWLRERYPNVPISVVPHGAAVPDDAEIATRRTTTRADLGWHEEHIVFGVFGGMHAVKRILVTVLAFGQVRRRWPQARLLIAGHVDRGEVQREILRTISSLGLTNSVTIVPSPAKQRFEELIAATDGVVNLRWPSAGETSGTMLRAFGVGRLVLVSDLPQNRHYDESFCWRIPTEPAAEAEALIAALERLVSEPNIVHDAGKRARDHVTATSTWQHAAAGYLAMLTELVDAPNPPTHATPMPGTSSSRSTEAGVAGLNLFADLRATTGLSESARRYALALHAAGVGMTFTEFNSMAPNRTISVPRQLAELRGGKDYPIDLWLANLNEFQLIPDSAIDRYTIALWAWELPEILDYTLAQLPRIDELWVVSSFCAEAFRTVTDSPVTVIPNVVPELTAAPDRAGLGLAEDALIVLFTFSASSSDARKNPWGVIEGFRAAFPPQERGRSAQLVIKAVDLQMFPELGAHLAEQVASVNGILIAKDLSRPAMDSLLASCDIYVSLHRSEGFGFGMAEAMSLGKAVVATGYGGNTDFMPPGSAAMVGYDIRPITEADHRFASKFGTWYRPGQLWAEPDVDQAARWLRRLADSPALRRRMGERAIAAIRDICGPAPVGELMKRRLAEIDPTQLSRRGQLIPETVRLRP